MDIYFRPDPNFKVRSETKITQDQLGEMIKNICGITLSKNKYNSYLNSEVETILDYYLDIKNKDQKDTATYFFGSLVPRDNILKRTLKLVKKDKYKVVVEERKVNGESFFVTKIGKNKKYWKYSILVYTFSGKVPTKKLFER